MPEAQRFVRRVTGTPSFGQGFAKACVQISLVWEARSLRGNRYLEECNPAMKPPRPKTLAAWTLSALILAAHPMLLLSQEEKDAAGAEPGASPAAGAEEPAPAPEAPAPAGQEEPPGGIGAAPAPAPQPPPGGVGAAPAPGAQPQPPGAQPQPAAGQPPARPPAGRGRANGQTGRQDGQGDEKKVQAILPKSPEFKGERVDIAEGEIEVLEFLRFLADYTGLPVIIDSTDPNVGKKPILIAAKMDDVTADIVIALLQANKFLVTRQVLPSGEEVLNVVSQQGAAPAPGEPVENPLLRVDAGKVEAIPDQLSTVTSVRPDEIATMVFTLKYTQPADAIQSLNSLIGGSKGQAAVKTQAFSIVDVKNSMLVIITAKFGLLNYLAKLLSIIDVPVKEPERIIQIIDIENSDADEMVQLIQTFLQGRTGAGGRFGGARGVTGAPVPGQPGQPTAGAGRGTTSDYQTNLIADWRTQKIIVETYSERDLEDIHMLVRELDARFDIRRLKTRIYQVRYLKADEVAADLQTLVGSSGGGFSGRAGLGTRGTTGARGSAGAGGRTGRTGGIGRVGRQPGLGTGAPTPGLPGQAGGGQNAPQPALIVPHIQTNSLIIQAEPEEYAEILNILDQIDIKRRQVFLEAALVEVTTGSDLIYTIELLAGEPNDRATRTLFESSFGLSGIDLQQFDRVIPDLSSPAAVPPGALLAIMNRGKFPALVRFFKSNTDTQVLATPFILADDNQPNVIDILETRYVQNTSTGTNQVSSVTNEGEDAGITLDITPTISSQSAVFLEMSLEVSAFQGGGTQQVLPPKTTNTIQSAVTIPDGEIFVIGGLTRENRSKSVSKVPILGDIPLLGKLFRSEASSKSLSNLYIFLRAHVLTHPEFKDGIDLTEQGLAKVEAFAPGMKPMNFDKPNVVLPPPKAPDPDRPQRIHTKSKFPEGMEAPRGPYDLKESRPAAGPASYEGDPERPDGARAEDTLKKTATAKRPEQKTAKPAPEKEPALPEPEEDLGGLAAPDMPPLTEPPPAGESKEALVPPALEGTGMEIDPEGDSWLVPLRPRK